MTMTPRTFGSSASAALTFALCAIVWRATAADWPDLASFNPVWPSAEPGGSYSENLPTAALLGNGSLGAVNGGDATRKLFVLTRGDFWSCGDLTPGYARNNVRALSFADFELVPGGRSVASTDTLDIVRGVLVTAGSFGAGRVRIESYVDANEDLFVMRGVSEADDEWTLRLTAHGKASGEFPSEAHADGFWVRRMSLCLTDEPGGWTTNVTAAVQVLGAALSDVTSDGVAVVTARVRVKSGVPFVFVVSSDPARRFSAAELAAAHARHEAWWRDWWGRSRLSLGDAELERFYYGSLYLLGAGVRGGRFPPGLYGIWVTTDHPSWHNDFHLNYNYVATFYGCWAANRCEVATDAPEPLLAYLPRAERNAKDGLTGLADCAGMHYPATAAYLARRTDLAHGIVDAALFPVALGPRGVSAEGDGKFWSQVSDGVFQCAVFCTHWEYTRDHTYLRRIWPLLDRTANFFLAWCEREVLPSGDYRYLVYDSHWEGSGLVKNSAPALGCVRHLFETLLEALPDLRALGVAGLTDAKISAWRDRVEHLSNYPTGLVTVGGREVRALSGVEREDGRADISLQPNAVTLEGIHPGEWCTFDMADEFRRLATNCVHAMWTNGGVNIFAAGMNQTAKLYTMAIRLGYPAAAVVDAFRRYEIRAHAQKNFHLRDGEHGVEKIGAIEFVNSMLLQSDHGFVKVFPNWIGTDAKFEKLRAKGGFLLSAEMKGGRVVGVRVTAERSGRLRLVNPFGDIANTVGWTVGRTRFSGEATLERDFAAGESVILTP